jgi:hypothetical protein
MDPQQQIEKASGIATALTAFAHAHPLITIVIVAIVVSWMATSIFKHILRRMLPDDIQDDVIRLFDCAVAGVFAFWMWPGDPAHLAWRVAAAIFAAGGSPLAYFLLAEAACWKWPGLRKFLTLRELTVKPDPETETGDDTGAIPPANPPGESK